MKKKILSIVLIGILVVSLTGCGNNNQNNTNNKNSNTELNNDENNNDNNLTCSGKTSLMIDILYGTTESKGDNSSSDDDIRIIAADYSNEYIENGEYTFIYDNDVLTSIKGLETFKKSFSAEVTDEQIKEANKENIKVYKDSNNKVIFEYTLDKNDDLFKAFRNKNNLKEWLEENTSLTCSGKSYSSILNDNNNSKDTETKSDISLKCSGKVYYAYEEYNFNFKYDASKKDYSLDSMYKNLTIPDGYDAKDYYTEEQISNMGKYEMSLNDRIITFKLDKTRAFWDEYRYKDYSYDELKDEFASVGFVCE